MGCLLVGRPSSARAAVAVLSSCISASATARKPPYLQGFVSGAEGIRTPDPLDAKGDLTSVPVVSSSMVSACFPYTAGVQSPRATCCHLVLAGVEGSVRG